MPPTTYAVVCPLAAFLLGWGISGRTNEETARPPTASSSPTYAPLPLPKIAEEPRSDQFLDAVLTAARGSLPFDQWPEHSSGRLGAAASDAPWEIAPLLSQLPDAQRVAPTLSVAAQWATTDPAATFAWIDSLPANDLSWKARGVALASWANVDPEAALIYFTELPAEEQRALTDEQLDAYSVLGSADAMARGRTVTANLLKHLPPGRGEQLLQLMENSERRDIRAAADAHRAELQFDAGDIDGAIASYGFDRFAVRLARTDPERALELALAQRWAIPTVIEEWARLDPNAALAAAQSITSGPDQDGSPQAALNAWRSAIASTDPRAAAATYTAENDALNNGSAFVEVLTNYLKTDSEEAIEWAVGLSGKARREAVYRLAIHWRNRGYTNPREMLIEAGFAPDEIPAQ